MNYLDILHSTNYWGELKKAPGKQRPLYVSWLLEQSKNSNISAVIGVRRSGKSTILKQVMHHLITQEDVSPNNTLLINLEDPRLIELLQNTNLLNLVSAFKDKADLRSRMYIVFDEIQNVPNWEAVIRTLHDQEKNLKIYVTGSSAELLGKELGTKLAGRYLTTEVFPLSFHEYQKFTKKDLKSFVESGGFPDPVLTTNQSVQEQLLKDYYESILLRDITARYGVRDDFKLRRLSAQLFASVANQASSYRLSRDLEVSPDTILQYFNYIEDAYLGFFVPKFSQSIRKQNYNPKKFYSIDNGLQSAISFRVLDDMGKLFENTVYLTLRRTSDQIYYWQEEKEVDFVVKEKERISHLVNASVSIKLESTREREITSLMTAMHALQKSESLLVIMNGENEVIETETGTIKVIEYEKLEGLLSKSTVAPVFL
ncbi:MAG: ATP-binding protein [Patescibacteria group bacterium]